MIEFHHNISFEFLIKVVEPVKVAQASLSSIHHKYEISIYAINLFYLKI
jgi:hypothetical protein